MTIEEAMGKLLAVKNAADGGTELISCQGQPMDGYSELANYRSILEEYLEGNNDRVYG